MAVIRIKRGTTDPSASNVTNAGELAANTSTPKLFLKTASDSSTTPVWIGAQIESSPGDWTSATKIATQSAINTTFMPKSGGTFTGVTSFGQGSTASGEIRLLEDSDNGTNYIALRAPAAVTANVTLTFPDGDGDAGQVLTTDGSGTLSWASAGAATTATNLAGGAAGSLPYQTAAATTTFLADPNVDGAILTYNNSTEAPSWSSGTGTGSPVRATSPTLTTPTLGVASATSVNKVTITAPATGSTLTIADGKTLTASNTLTFTGTDASSVAFGTGGTVAYTGGKLSQFAATTSSELAGVISDETGSGALVFGTSPAFTTSVTTGSTTLGVFDGTATTVNAFGAATTLNLGEDGSGTATTNLNVSNSGTKTVNVATGTGGARTVNIATGSSSNLVTRTVNILDTAQGLNTVNLPTGSSFNWDNSSPSSSGYVRLAYGLATTGLDPFVVSIGTNATGTGEVNVNIGTSGLGTTTVNNNMVVSGNLTVNGTTTNINTTNLVVEDKNIILGDVATPTDVTADGGGITLKGTSDKTLNWVDSTDAWTSSEHFNLLTGKAYYINGTSVLNGTTLGSGVTTSSLTTVGALSSGSIASGFTAINVANLINLASLDIDGGTATTTIIGTDLLIVDDGANGTNRYVTVDNLFGSSSTATVDGGTY